MSWTETDDWYIKNDTIAAVSKPIITDSKDKYRLRLCLMAGHEITIKDLTFEEAENLIDKLKLTKNE